MNSPICRYPGIVLEVQGTLSNTDLMDVVAKQMLNSGVAPETVAEYVRSVNGKSWNYVFEASQGWIRVSKTIPAPPKAIPERPMFANIEDMLRVMRREGHTVDVLVEHNGKGDGFRARIVDPSDHRVPLFSPDEELRELKGLGTSMVAALVELNKLCVIKEESC